MKSMLNHWSKQGLCVLLSGIMIVGCGTTSQFMPGSGKKHAYRYRLTAPQPDRQLIFEDERISVRFTIDEAAVQFRLQNKTSGVARIQWDRVVMGVGGEFQRVRHATDLYALDLDPRPFPLPSGGFVRDLMMPNGGIYYDGRTWVERPLFPTVDEDQDSLRRAIMGNVGRNIRIVLPVQFADHSVEYDFEFTVDNVSRIEWKDYVVVTREPRPPSPSKEVKKTELTLTAAIVVGFLATFALFVSAEKSPPSE